MAVDFETISFNSPITDGQTNSGIPTEQETNIGIKFNSNSDAVIVNKFLYNLSSAIKFIQDSGAILWIKDKEYTEGSIVNIIEHNGEDYTLRKFRCISKTPTKVYPVNGRLNEDRKYLSLFFEVPNTVNSEQWVEIIELEEFQFLYKVPERTKNIKLFNIPNSGYNRLNFDVLVERYNTNIADYDRLQFTVEFQCSEYNSDLSNTFVEVRDVFCTNYERTSYESQANGQGQIPPTEYGFVFGKSRFDLLGINLQLANNALYMNIYSDDNAYIDDEKEIKINFKVNTGNFQLIPVTTNEDLQMDENTLVIVDGYNNTGNDCGYVVESSIRYTTEELFKRSLLIIDESTCISNESKRPGKSQVFQKKFNPHNVVSYIYDSSNRDYSKHVFPRIYGLISTVVGIKSVYYSNSGAYLMDDSNITMVTYSDSSTAYAHPVKYDTNDLTLKKRRRTYTITTHDTKEGNFEKNIFNSKNPELNIHSNNPELYPKSKRIYKYFKY